MVGAGRRGGGLGARRGRLRSLRFVLLRARLPRTSVGTTQGGADARERRRGRCRVGRAVGPWVLGQDAWVLPYEVRHGDGRRAWAHPPYRTATAGSFAALRMAATDGGQGCARPTATAGGGPSAGLLGRFEDACAARRGGPALRAGWEVGGSDVEGLEEGGGLVEGGLVAVGWAVAPGALVGGAGVADGGLGVAFLL